MNAHVRLRHEAVPEELKEQGSTEPECRFENVSKLLSVWMVPKVALRAS